MQKAVINAIVASGLAHDPDGMREVYMDKRKSTFFVCLATRDVQDSGLRYWGDHSQRMEPKNNDSAEVLPKRFIIVEV